MREKKNGRNRMTVDMWTEQSYAHIENTDTTCSHTHTHTQVVFQAIIPSHQPHTPEVEPHPMDAHPVIPRHP